jgi:hypothetical protein
MRGRDLNGARMNQLSSHPLFEHHKKGRDSVGLVHAQKQALECALAEAPLDNVLNLIVRSMAAWSEEVAFRTRNTEGPKPA